MRQHPDPIDVVTKVYYYLDERRYQDILELFVPDGKWFRKEKWRQGRADILASLNERPATQIVRHVITNAHLDQLNADQAVVRAYMLSYTFDDGAMHQTPIDLAGPNKLFVMEGNLSMVGSVWKLTSLSSCTEFSFKR